MYILHVNQILFSCTNNLYFVNYIEPKFVTFCMPSVFSFTYFCHQVLFQKILKCSNNIYILQYTSIWSEIVLVYISEEKYMATVRLYSGAEGVVTSYLTQ